MPLVDHFDDDRATYSPRLYLLGGPKMRTMLCMAIAKKCPVPGAELKTSPSDNKTKYDYQVVPLHRSCTRAEPNRIAQIL